MEAAAKTVKTTSVLALLKVRPKLRRAALASASGRNLFPVPIVMGFEVCAAGFPCSQVLLDCLQVWPTGHPEEATVYSHLYMYVFDAGCVVLAVPPLLESHFGLRVAAPPLDV